MPVLKTPIRPVAEPPSTGQSMTPWLAVVATETGYRDARPGYDVRTLIAAANILARSGQQQACEDVLATTRNTYKLYVADLKSGKTSIANEPDWQQREVAAATPVTARDTSFRSDQLIGTEVRNPQNEALGSVDDLVMSPQTGKIAYLIIARGGFLGMDKNYVPVPWEDFKATPNASLLVLDSTKSAMEASPHVSHNQFATPGQFDQQSQKVDAYWKRICRAIAPAKPTVDRDPVLHPLPCRRHKELVAREKDLDLVTVGRRDRLDGSAGEPRCRPSADQGQPGIRSLGHD